VAGAAAPASESEQSSSWGGPAAATLSLEGSAAATAYSANQMLTKLIPATTTVLSQVYSVAERGRDMYAAVERLDLEGIVAKRKADAYRPETVWYKIKSRTYRQGERRWELFQKRV
jgi:hypothetical protein